MKARIKETREIIEVSSTSSMQDPIQTFAATRNQYEEYSVYELDFNLGGTPKEIDWEQRRYEISRDFLCATESRTPTFSAEGIVDACQHSIRAADELIKLLRK